MDIVPVDTVGVLAPDPRWRTGPVLALTASLLALSCRPSPESYCNSSCEAQARCEPALVGFEPQCVQVCLADFEDPEKIVDDCALAEPRHPIDPAGPHTANSVIDSGQCFIQQGCLEEDEETQCEDVRQICLDGLNQNSRCNRSFQIARARCSDLLRRCFEARPDDRTVCSEDFNRCDTLAREERDACLSGA